jgi:hypothetical protein
VGAEVTVAGLDVFVGNEIAAHAPNVAVRDAIASFLVGSLR